MPQAVSKAFSARHTQATVINWYDKDGVGFVARFMENSDEIFTRFDANGNFQKEESSRDDQQDGEHDDNDEDNEDTENGCECGPGDND